MIAAALAMTVTLGTAGIPLDDTWTMCHNWRMEAEHMANPEYMPTVWRSLCTGDYCIGDVIANDPHTDKVRRVQVLNEPDMLGGSVHYWAERYAEAYHEIKRNAQGETLVGGLSLYWCESHWLEAFSWEIQDLGAELEWLGVHAYLDWDTVTTYIERARGTLGGIPIYITEAGHLYAHSHAQGIAYIRDLRAWLQGNERLGIERVYWFVTYDPCTPLYTDCWEELSPGTALYFGDGRLTPTGRAWWYGSKVFCPEVRG